MALHCINGGSECTGCLRCEPKSKIVGYCAYCKEAIYDWEDHYEMEGDVLLHDDCLTSWADQYRVTA